MGMTIGSSIVTDGLILHLDAAYPPSFPGPGYNQTTRESGIWYDVSKNNYNYQGAIYPSTMIDNEKGGCFYFQTGLPFTAGSIEMPIKLPTGDISMCISVKRMYNDLSPQGDMIRYTNENTYGTSGDIGFVWSIRTLGNEHVPSFFCFSSFRDLGSIPYYGTQAFNTKYNDWNFLTVTLVNNGTLKFYVDDKLSSTSYNVTRIEPSGNMYLSISKNIRGFPYHSDGITGKIANFSIYNKILSLSEISQNYNSMRKRFGI